MSKLTKAQSDILEAIASKVGQTVEVITSDYDANIPAEYRARAVFLGTTSPATLRGLQAKGYIANLKTYWKGACFDVLAV